MFELAPMFPAECLSASALINGKEAAEAAGERGAATLLSQVGVVSPGGGSPLCTVRSHKGHMRVAPGEHAETQQQAFISGRLSLKRKCVAGAACSHESTCSDTLTGSLPCLINPRNLMKAKPI